MKNIIVVLLLLAAGISIFVVVRNSSQARKAEKGGMVMKHPVKCAACGKMYDLSFADMNDFIKSGKAMEAPGQAVKFPCATCGKVEVTLYDGKYDQYPESNPAAPEKASP